MSFFCKFFFESHLNDQTQGWGAGFFLFLGNFKKKNKINNFFVILVSFFICKKK